MEPKKNPKYDVHRHRALLYNISLAISILLVIGVFKITAPYRKTFDPPPPGDDAAFYVEPDVKSTRQQEPTIKKKEMVRLTRAVNFVPVEEEPAESEAAPPVDMGTEPDWLEGLGAVPAERPDSVVTFRIVEKMPEPVGGWPAFYEMLRKNMRYPPIAVRNNITGKVFIEYTINERGQPVDITIIKGIGYGCDEEAQRIIPLIQWNPGKQRGKPVRVRMAQAIEFRLN